MNKHQPFPYQMEGIQDINQFGGRTLLAWDMGLGKTMIALWWFEQNPRAHPAVVVCPASAKYHWEHEAFHQIGARATVLEGRTSRSSSWDGGDELVILNYDILPYWLNRLRKRRFRLLVLDECHAIKNRDAQRTKAAKVLSKGIPYALALSGTPLTNKPIELFTTLNLLRPSKFKHRHPFAMEFCSPKWTPWGWKYDGASNTPKLHKMLRKTCMLRKLKSEVLSELPPKTRRVLELEMSRPEEYEEATEHFLEWMARENPAKLAGARRAAGLVKLGYLKRLAAKLKARAVVEWINEWLGEFPDEKIVVFAIHRKMVELLRRRVNAPSVEVSGRITGRNRKAVVDKFQSDRRTRVLVGNIRAAGEAITLTAASTVIFSELDWVPSRHVQAEDRCLDENQLVYCPQTVYNGSMSIKKIRDIEIGDVVLTSKGREAKVIAKQRKTNLDGRMTRIRYVGWHDPIECTFDHKLLVVRKGKQKTEWVEAYSVLPCDSLVLPRPISSIPLHTIKIKDEWRRYPPLASHCIIPDCHRPITARQMCSLHYRKWLKDTPKDEREKGNQHTNGRYVRLPDEILVDNEWLYVFGWFAAEGFASVSKGKSDFVSLAGHKKERHILERCGCVFDRLKINWSIYSRKEGNGIELRAYSTELARWFRSWFGHGARNKRLPKEIIHLPEDQANVVLEAYIDGDGYRRKNQCEWVSVSLDLSYQFCILAAKCGYSPTLHLGSSKSGKAFVGGFSLTNKTDNPFLLRKVRSVESYYEKRPYVYDIEVDKDESFVVGFSAVHNCHRIGQKSVSWIWYLVAGGTIEEDLCELLQQKQKVSNAVLDGGDNPDDLDIYSRLMGKYRKLL